jgi:serine phosphatase RsbU (regulator of sigma subunit)
MPDGTPPEDDPRIGELRAEAEVRDLELDRLHERELTQDALIARLRAEAGARDADLADLRERLASSERELEDLRAIRDALTPPELPERPGIDLAAGFIPAAERVSGDFYLVAEGPRDSTVLVVGDVVGHGLGAARRAAFTRTTFAATAPYSDDPCRLLDWTNAALRERSTTQIDFVTTACITYQPHERTLRWAYAGHPPALWLDEPGEVAAPRQGAPLGIVADPGYVEGSIRPAPPSGVLIYTDGLTEARHGRAFFGLDRVTATLGDLRDRPPEDIVHRLRAEVAEFAGERLRDDLCLLAARFE